MNSFYNKYMLRIVENKIVSKLFIATKMSDELRAFGYGFNDEGVLKKIEQNSDKLGEVGFEFNVSNDPNKNQNHYDALGEVITNHVYELLEKNGMHRIYLEDNLPKEQAPFIFYTKTRLESPKKLLILIHGTGVVRAGQWARSLIINQSLDHGTQIPYIKKARELGYDVLITNTNDNSRLVDGVSKAIPGHGSPTAHARKVWENLIIPSNPEYVGIVAHSYGGVVTMDLAEKFPEFFKTKVFAIGFTDSVHSSSGLKDFVKQIARNFVTSSKNMGDKLSNNDKDVPRYSAGHIKHEWTSYACMPALFDFMEQRYEHFSANKHTKKQKIES